MIRSPPQKNQSRLWLVASLGPRFIVSAPLGESDGERRDAEPSRTIGDRSPTSFSLPQSFSTAMNENRSFCETTAISAVVYNSTDAGCVQFLTNRSLTLGCYTEWNLILIHFMDCALFPQGSSLLIGVYRHHNRVESLKAFVIRTVKSSFVEKKTHQRWWNFISLPRF